MPKRKRSYGGYRGAKRRKRTIKPPARRRTRRRWRIPRGIRSQKRVVKLRFCQTQSLNPGTGAIDFHSYSANSAAQPDTASTHQPRYMDELENLYNHYCVLGSKITVKMIKTTASNDGMAVGGIFLSDDNTFSSTVNDMTEQNRSMWRLLTPSYDQRPYTLKKTFSARKFFNIVDAKDNVKRLGAAMGSAPAEEAHFIVWVGAVDTTVDQLPYQAYVMIDYIVMLSEPKEIGASATTT